MSVLEFRAKKLWSLKTKTFISSDMVIMQLHFDSFEYETQVLYQDDFTVFLCKFLLLFCFINKSSKYELSYL